MTPMEIFALLFLVLFIALCVFIRKLHRRLEIIERLCPKNTAPASQQAPVQEYRVRQIVADAVREHTQEKHDR